MDEVRTEIEQDPALHPVDGRREQIVENMPGSPPGGGPAKAELIRDAPDDRVAQRHVVQVHDQVDVVAEMLGPSLVVAQHHVAHTLLVIGGEEGREEAARQ